MASAAEQLAANLNFSAFAKATELHKRLLFTLGALIVYRLGTYIPIPGIDLAAFERAFSGQSQGILGMFNMFSGGAVERMAIFALNIMPYISASIIVQLMGSVYAPWEKLRKEGGEAGRKQLNQYTRYLALILALVQSFSIAAGMQASGLALDPGPMFLISSVVTLTGGTMFLMWLGEQITARGVGNGTSLIIFAGIVAVLPRTIGNLLALAKEGQINAGVLLLIVLVLVAAIVFIVFMERSQRRLLVQYPKRQVGNRVMGGESSFMPLKVNTAGVIPPIFASSLLLMPTTAAAFLARDPSKVPEWLSWLPGVTAQLTHGQPVFMALYAAMIIFFCFLYTSLVFNPDETAENLRKYGGFLPGIRPGKRTAEYLDFVLTRITVIGAAYITIVCLLPEFLISNLGNSFYFGGTSILIVVTVTMDTVAQIQSHLLAHQYDGLIKKSKMRGARGR
ncbi:preprotein translocase subunit SecY [Asticcacaulis sp. DW145]|jgi:preprotein translocase subunit SecY|uniref:Protein translocase subunit SecY n=1 Tax=Asticcacaulis currens TaxID=2984210 RepID=A0ABT5IC61_9CAUL|nr:preprotein translocase subunit SecY [Asticcacaulis currens]MDC7693770.1 preprotein translocase subunit SecY [Asticcacaulis currens]BEV10269.1 preprotein translocase subunit SecY [Asticcacaulis sp. DW145]